MVNEEKVRLMTKAAMIKKKEERKTFTISRFYGDDFVSFQAVKGVIGVTIAFVLILALWVLENSEILMTQYPIANLFALAGNIIFIYLLVVLATVLISVLVYTARFWKSKETAKEYQSSLKKLQRMYQKDKDEQGE